MNIDTRKTDYLSPEVRVVTFRVESGFTQSNPPQDLIFRDDSHPMEQYNTQSSDGSTNFFRWE